MQSTQKYLLLLCLFSMVTFDFVQAQQPNDDALKPRMREADLFLDPSYGTGTRHRHKRGYHWSLYSIKMPMAWEVTQGQQEITTLVSDQLSDTNGLADHPDLTNYNVINSASGNMGDGSHSTLPLYNRHPVMVVSTVSATPDNGFPMVGTAPNSKVIGIDFNTFPHYSSTLSIDVDGVNNGDTVLPHVLNMSYVGGGPTWLSWYVTSGGVAVSGAANDLRAFGTWGASNQAIPGTTATLLLTLYPSRHNPASIVVSDPLYPNDPSKDAKVIAVGGLEDGEFYGGTCMQLWNSSRSILGSDPQANVRGEERFVPNYNFSPGTNKFDPTSRENRRSAMVDVVAPAWDVFMGVDAIPLPPGSPWSQLTADHFAKYRMGAGTSLSTPMVSGICALMLGINPQMGTSGIDVQRQVYNAVTFTADKLVDNGNLASGYFVHEGQWYTYSTTNLDGSPYQFHYLLQNNDKMKRTWAQRMGFGKVNAYRSVAHAIPKKGDYEYSSSTTFDISGATQNERGESLLHLGAFVREDLDLGGEDRNGNSLTDDLLSVLEWGGAHLVAGTDQHNNQGVTRLTGSGRVELHTPSATVVAIDGILTGEVGGDYKVVYAAEPQSKVLVEGKLENVLLVGNLRLSDLIIDGVGDKSGVLFRWSPSNEVYGRVQVQGDGRFALDGSTLVHLKPGSDIILEGNNDLLLSDTYGASQLILESASRVSSSIGRKIVVGHGTALIVDTDAHAEIDCEVVVENGGTFSVRPGADVKLAKFTIEQGGTFIIENGAHVELTKNVSRDGIISHSEGQNFWFGGKLTGRRAGFDEGCCAEECPEVVDYARVEFRGTAYIHMMGMTVSNATIHVAGDDIAFVNLEYSSFFANSETSQFFPSPYLVGIYGLRNINTIRIHNCTFADNAPTSLVPLYQVLTRAGGLHIWGCRNIDNISIRNNRFDSLYAGTEISHSDRNIYVSDNTYVGSYCGALQTDAPTLYCSNTFDKLTWGLYAIGPTSFEVFDNSFTSISRSNHYFKVNQALLRSNQYTSYDTAITSVSSGVYLAPLGSSLFGRNTFSSGKYVDLHERDGGSIELFCGWNTFATPEDGLHVHARASNPLDGNYNDYSGYVPRGDISAGFINYGQTLSPLCGDTTFSPAYCTPLSFHICDIDSIQVNGPWVRVFPGGSVWIPAKDLAIDTTLADSCRAKLLELLYHLERQDTTGSWAGEFLDLLRDILGLPGQGDLRRKAELYLGLQHLRGGSIDSSLYYMELVRAQGSGVDSIYADWSISLIESGSAADIGIADSQKRVHWEKVFGGDSSLPGPYLRESVGGTSARESSAYLRVHPVPAIEQITVESEWEGAPASELHLYDVQGRLARVYGEAELQHRRQVTLSVKSLPGGVYILRAYREGQHQASAKVLIEK